MNARNPEILTLRRLVATGFGPVAAGPEPFPAETGGVEACVDGKQRWQGLCLVTGVTVGFQFYGNFSEQIH